jgi:hypothetical protein
MLAAGLKQLQDYVGQLQAALAGDAARADEFAEEAERAYAELVVRPGGAFVFGFGGVCGLARAHLAAGRADRGEALVIPLLAAAERSGWQEAIASLSLVLGQCCAARADDDGARAHLVAAIDRCCEHGLPGVEWEARAALAQMSSDVEAGRLREQSAAVVLRLAATIGDAALADGFVRSAQR